LVVDLPRAAVRFPSQPYAADVSCAAAIPPARLHSVHCRIWWEAGRPRAQPLVGRGTSSFLAIRRQRLGGVPPDATDAPVGTEVAVRPLTEPSTVEADPPAAQDLGSAITNIAAEKAVSGMRYSISRPPTTAI
jgi:hypothetical protein